MKKLISTVLLFMVSANYAHAKSNGKPPQHLVKMFTEQCMFATNNKPMCKCATTAFKRLVPKSELSIGHHQNGSSTHILQFPEEYIVALEPEVELCERAYPLD